MNKTSIYYFSLAAIAIGSLASCQDYEPFDEATVREAALSREFTKNFEDRYGKIDPNHDWGFEVLKSFDLKKGSTRAGSEDDDPNVYVRRNQWATPSTEEYLLDKMTVPGWPNFDGYDYTVDLSGGYSDITTTPDLAAQMPAGDITDYEIWYVSKWFREHRNPTTIHLHLSDFFIQNVSGDADRVISKATVDGEIVDVCNGDPITTGILSDVTADCTFGMEKLQFKSMDEEWTHTNNFNRGNTNDLKDVAAEDLPLEKQGSYDSNGVFVNTNTHDREMKFVTSSGTEDFAYMSTYSSGPGDHYFDKWVLVRLEWDEKGMDGEMHTRVGYYLAFDYEANSEGDVFNGDGFYSNWIVKISPAYATEEPSDYSRRVMCEDLGNTYDFDFNDVVFDVYYEGDDAVITLRASGGTLPIYVGKDPSNTDYEAHNLLEHDSKTPVNVSAPGNATHAVAIYRIPATSTDPDDIPVYVVNGDRKNANNIIVLRPVKANSDPIEYEKGSSVAPQKFCVPVGVRWMKESMQIESSYEKFDAWVCDATLGHTHTQPWYHNSFIVNSGNIYNSGENGISREEDLPAVDCPYLEFYEVYGNRALRFKSNLFENNPQSITIKLNVPKVVHFTGYDEAGQVKLKINNKEYELTNSKNTLTIAGDEINTIKDNPNIDIPVCNFDLTLGMISITF